MSRWQDSNLRPLGPKPSILPTVLHLVTFILYSLVSVIKSLNLKKLFFINFPLIRGMRQHIITTNIITMSINGTKLNDKTILIVGLIGLEPIL